MKKRNLIIALIAPALIFGSCKKSDTDCNLIAAKIIRYDCDRVIFQLLTTESIGDTEWEDVQTGQRYSNVVSYYNTCKISELANGEMLTLYVSLNQPDNNTNIPCYQCLAVSQNPPQTQVDFVEISKSPCEISSDR